MVDEDEHQDTRYSAQWTDIALVLIVSVLQVLLTSQRGQQSLQLAAPFALPARVGTPAMLSWTIVCLDANNNYLFSTMNGHNNGILRFNPMAIRDPFIYPYDSNALMQKL